MKRLFTIIYRALFVLVLITILLFTSAPYLLNNNLLPHLLKANGASDITIQISHLSPWSIAGTANLSGNNEVEAMRTHFHIHYQPAELLRGKISTIVLDGLTVRMVYSEGKLKLRKFPPAGTSQNDRSRTFSMPLLPLMTESFVIRNSQIILENTNHPTLPFNFQGIIHPDFTKDSSGNFIFKALRADFLSEGLIPISLQAELELADEKCRLNIHAALLDTAGISTLLPLPGKFQLSGTAQLEGELFFATDLRSTSKINAQISFPGLELVTDAFSLTSSKNDPLLVTANGNLESFHYSVENIHFRTPDNIRAELQGTFRPISGELAGHGTITADALEHSTAIEVQGNVESNNTELAISMQGDKQQLQLGLSTILLGPYHLATHFSKTTSTLQITETVQIDSIRIPKYNLLLENITSHMPVALNGSGKKLEPGTTSIKKIRYNNENLAGLTVTTEQTANGVTFSGEAKSHLASPLLLKFTGASTNAIPLTLSFTLPTAKINNRSLPSFMKLPSDLQFSGTIQASGTLDYTEKRPRGDVKISLTDGELDLSEKNVHLRGIASDIVLPSLPQLSSTAHQLLHISTMDIGNLKFTDGKIFYHVEDQQTLFIEKSRFTWCNGKVESGSLQISKATPELSTTLYCDRLQFSELLSQLGISDTEGDGSLNGRLPLHFNGKEMSFDDGFLFSTPGNSGIVRFNNTAILRQGLPETGQAAYLEYSMQAMENFSYNWTKLTFNSAGDDLLISMQIDGKPATPLPFGYRSGQLVSQGEGQGIQHPIRLDVNFHLPFNQMFKYGQNLQKILENMK